MALAHKILLTIALSLAALLASLIHGQSTNMPGDEQAFDALPSPYHKVDLLRISSELTNSPDFEAVNAAIERFVNQWELVGASVAIAHGDRLIYTRGFGYANKEDSVVMQPYNVLRVASVSKLITSIAIMRLVEDGRLSLTDTVFGPSGILNDTIFQPLKDPRLAQITVGNLMNHSAGWNTRYGDHMFIKHVIADDLGLPLPISLTDIVRFATTRRKLHFNPGTWCSYCNIGYAILQLVIERITGVEYEEFVQQTVMRPLRIYDAGLADGWDSLKLAHEVRYYEMRDAEPIIAYDGSNKMALKSRGGNDIRTLGAAGGWAISAVSLVRLLMAVDGNSTFPDIITPESVQTMVSHEENFYPYGWISADSTGTLWRTGSLPGTTVLAKANEHGYTFAFIANTSPWKGSRFPAIINNLMLNQILPMFDTMQCQRNMFLPHLPNIGLLPISTPTATLPQVLPPLANTDEV